MPPLGVREDGGRPVPLGMVYVPGGTFRLGGRTVSLGGFAIDRVEVTAGAWRVCVTAGACEALSDPLGQMADGAAPVVNVTHERARRYCAWAGGRLPTEAEWEFAARGTDERTWPWGERRPDCSLARLAGCGSGWTLASTRAAGASPFGVLDLAGSVAEWVADRHGPLPGEGHARDPVGPARGSARVVRGGSFLSTEAGITAGARGSAAPEEARVDLGFRCVRGL